MNLLTCADDTCWNNLLQLSLLALYQPCYEMISTYSRLVNNLEEAVRTHLVDKL